MYHSPKPCCSSLLQNLCSVIKLTELFAEAFHRLPVIAKTYFAASVYAFTGVVTLLVFLLYVLIIAAYIKLQACISGVSC